MPGRRGRILGHRIDGVQAESARVPFADTSTHPLPEQVGDEEAPLLADILPTAYEVGVRSGDVAPGDVLVVVGAGPIGLAAVRTAQLLSPSRVIAVGPAPARREAAERHGAHLTPDPGEDVVERVRELTDGLGADVGVHGRPATLHPEDLWIRDVEITTGLVDTSSPPALLRMLAARRLGVRGFVTHRSVLHET